MTEKKKTSKAKQEDYAPMTVQGKAKRVQVSVAVEAETAEKLNEIFFDARGKYRSRNELVRNILTEYVTNYKYGTVSSESTTSSK